MGLAVLPARLKQELELLRDCLLDKKNFNDYDVLKKHRAWYDELRENKANADNVDQLLK